MCVHTHVCASVFLRVRACPLRVAHMRVHVYECRIRYVNGEDGSSLAIVGLLLRLGSAAGLAFVSIEHRL